MDRARWWVEMNAVEIEEAVSALAVAPFNPAEFPYAFLEAFGNKGTTVKRLCAGVSSEACIDVEIVVNGRNQVVKVASLHP